MYFDNPVGHGTALIRSSAIAKVGGYSDAYGPNEDYDLWRRIVATGGEIALIPDVLYLYRLNPSGISSTNQELQHRFFADLVNEIWQGPVQFKSFLQIAADGRYYKRLNSPFRQTVYEQYKSHQIRLAMEFLSRGHLRTSWNTFLGALLIDPVPAARLGTAVAAPYLKALIRHARRRATQSR